MNETASRSLAEIQQLTREYASFSQRRSGLGNVLGGVAGVLIFLALWLLGPGAVTAAITLGLTVVWLVGKEVIRQRLYRPFGDAREFWPEPERRSHRIIVCVLAIFLAGFAVAIVVHTVTASASWAIAVPYLLFCLVTPWITWRYLRTANEGVVGLYLLFASAVTCAGFVPDPLLFAAILPLYSVLLIGLGLREHRQFQQVAVGLRGQRAVQG